MPPVGLDHSMKNHTHDSMRSAAFATLSLAVIWIVAAAWRPTNTYHLAPILIVGVGPAMLRSSRRSALRASGVGALVAAVTTAILAFLNLLQGPSFLSSGGALAEAVLFTTTTALVLAAAGALPFRRSAH